MSSLRDLSLALDALADLAPGADVSSVYVNLKMESIRVEVPTDAAAKALALATGLPGPGDIVGDVKHPLVQYCGRPPEFPEIKLTVTGHVQ